MIMCIIKLIKRLPFELQDTIWNMHWGSIYKENVVFVLKNIKFEIDKMNFFLEKYFYPNISNTYDKQISHYLKECNAFLVSLKKNKGVILLISNLGRKYKNFRLCFKDSYTKNFPKVSLEYRELCVYCLCNGLPYMGYYTLERFMKLSL